jgi:hypothetical protein
MWRTADVELPTNWFSTLTQVRRTYDIAEDLIPSILEEGQITRGLVAALTPAEGLVYVQKINGIYGSFHTLDDLTLVHIDGEPLYLPLFAGHRRYLTIEHVNEGLEKGTYFLSQTSQFTGLYRATLHFGISAEKAIELQFHENRHSAPPPHEEAEAAWRFYRFLQLNNDSLTPSVFARSIGRTTEWVRNALRFCALPSAIQAYVTGDNPIKQKLPFGILVHLARLAEKYLEITSEVMEEPAMHFWVQEALASRLKVQAFGNKVTAYLENKRLDAAGQHSLFSLAPSPVEQERHLRRVVGQDMVRGVWGLLHYLKTVERLRQAHVLGHESYLGPNLTVEAHDLYSPKSPIRVMSEVLEVVKELVPHLAELSRQEGTGHARRLLAGHPLLDQVAVAFQFFAAAEEQVLTGALH